MALSSSLLSLSLFNMMEAVGLAWFGGQMNGLDFNLLMTDWLVGMVGYIKYNDKCEGCNDHDGDKSNMKIGM